MAKGRAFNHLGFLSSPNTLHQREWRENKQRSKMMIANQRSKFIGQGNRVNRALFVACTMGKEKVLVKKTLVGTFGCPRNCMGGRQNRKGKQWRESLSGNHWCSIILSCFKVDEKPHKRVVWQMTKDQWESQSNYGDVTLVKLQTGND